MSTSRAKTPRRVWAICAALGTVLVLIIGGGAYAAASSQDKRSCEEIRQDNLRLSDIYPPTMESMAQGRANNREVTRRHCAWAYDGHSGPAN